MIDDGYNAASRQIQMRLDIYLDDEPLVVTHDNYLMSSTLLEEVQAETQDMLGTVSSNELTFELLNENRMFTPTNADGPYYYKIRKNVKVVAMARAYNDTEEWDILGTFYVKEWQTTSSGMTAAVTANDRMYDVFDAPLPTYYVKSDVQVKDFLKDFFNKLTIPATIDESLTETLPYAFVHTSTKVFLNDIMQGALAMCYGDRSDGVKVSKRLKTRELRATLTDNDQIISVDTTQSVEMGYDGASVVLNKRQESSNTELIFISDQHLATGQTTLRNIDLRETPMARVQWARVLGNKNVKVKSIISTPDTASLYMSNEGTDDAYVDIKLYGSVLSKLSSTDADSGNNLLVLDSNYVQTTQQASTAHQYLRRVIASQVPTIVVSTRGNFRLMLGDKVRIQSDRFKTDYTGIILRSEYSYNGGLHCKLTIADATLFEEVT